MHLPSRNSDVSEIMRHPGLRRPFTVLLDSGSSGSLVSPLLVKYGKKIISGARQSTWNTPAGKMKTGGKIRQKFKLLEFSNNKSVTYDFHVAPSKLLTYDMIIGRDLLTTLKNAVRFRL